MKGLWVNWDHFWPRGLSGWELHPRWSTTAKPFCGTVRKGGGRLVAWWSGPWQLIYFSWQIWGTMDLTECCKDCHSTSYRVPPVIWIIWIIATQLPPNCLGEDYVDGSWATRGELPGIFETEFGRVGIGRLMLKKRASICHWVSIFALSYLGFESSVHIRMCDKI